MSEQSDPQPSQALNLAEFELSPGTTLIEASAGTGKTYTIQYIVLDLLLKGLGLREILVVTFTEAATQELCDRLQSFLAQVHAVLSGDVVPDEALKAVLERAHKRLDAEEVKSVIRRALLHIDEAPIYTIHGFCQRALQENAFAADSAFAPEVCSDPGSLVEGLTRDFMRMANLGMTFLPAAAKLDNLMRRGKLLTGLLRTKKPFEGEMMDLIGVLDARAAGVRAFEGEIDSIKKEFLGYQGKLNGAIYKPAFYEDFEALLRNLFSDPFGVDVKSLEKLSDDKIAKSFKKAHQGTELQSGFFAACQEFLDAKVNFEPEFLRYFDTWFIREFCRLKTQNGQITYDDMILNLDRALQAQERLRRQLKRRYRAALVDEFQDTDARQYSIFKTLFAPDPPGDESPYFAMIGDPKQSIYSFRGADINAYLEARNDAHHRYTLPVNYRSEQSVIEGVNQFFQGADLGRCGGAPAKTAIPFEPVDGADRSGKPRLVFAEGIAPPRLFERVVTSPEENFGEANKATLRQLVRDVASLLQYSEEGRVLLETSVDGEPLRRMVHAGDIAVLVDTHWEAAEVQGLFQSAGVLAVRGKSGDIFQTKEAAHFLQFLLTCLNPGERRLNVLLVSPLYGKTDAGLKQFTDSERQEAYGLFSLLGRSWRDGESVSAIWARFLDAIGARARLLARPDGERLLTNYLHICELAQELERASALSPERLTDRILEMVKKGSDGVPSEGDAGLIRLESDDRAVKILTMHSAKGLEFPIVFLPSLWQKTVKQKNAEILVVDAADPDCLDSIAKNPELVLERQRSEALRIGYVAMTRAVHFCVYYNVRGLPVPGARSNHSVGWFDSWLQDQRGEVSPPDGSASFLEELEGAPPLEIPEIEPPAARQARKLERAIANSYQITSYSSLARGEQARVSSSEEPSISGGLEESLGDASVSVAMEEEAAAEPDLLLESFPGGVRTGTCIHEILERCDFTSREDWERVIEPVVQRHFPESGQGRLARQVSEVGTLLEQLTGSPRPVGSGDQIDLSRVENVQRMHEMEFYFPVHQVDVSELERIIERWASRVGLEYGPGTFADPQIDGYLTGSVDLFFAARERYYLLDWKTNSPLPGRSRLLTSYGRDGMHDQMCHGRYYLQALIYSVATSAFLKDRLGEAFDWETHIGGFVYCYVRGLGSATGWFHGCFSEKEIEAAAVALGQSSIPVERSVHE